MLQQGRKASVRKAILITLPFMPSGMTAKDHGDEQVLEYRCHRAGKLNKEDLLRTAFRIGSGTDGIVFQYSSP